MKKLVASGGIALLTIPSLCYYIAKYYIDKSLTFEQSMIYIFSLLCGLIIIGILLGFYNAYQNLKLKNDIKELKDIIKQYHYDNLEYHEDNREIILDLLDKGEE